LAERTMLMRGLPGTGSGEPDASHAAAPRLSKRPPIGNSEP